MKQRVEDSFAEVLAQLFQIGFEFRGAPDFCSLAARKIKQ